MIRTLARSIALVALLTIACDPYAHENVTADAPKMRSLFRLVARADRAAHGFSPLPKTGEVGLMRRRRFRSGDLGFEHVALSAHIQSRTWSRAWYFGRRDGTYQFLCETETFHGPHLVSSPTINDGKEFFEFVRIEEVEDDRCPMPLGRRAFHWGPEGKRELPLSEALTIARSLSSAAPALADPLLGN